MGSASVAAGTTGDSLVIGFGYEPSGHGEKHSTHREAVRKFGEQAAAPALERAREAGLEATVLVSPP